MKRKIIFVLVILLFFGFVVINCNAQSSTKPLVGKWFNEEEGTFEFFKDGSGIFKEDFDEEGDKFTWTAKENGLLTIKYYDEDDDDISETYNYKISGSVLTLDGDMIFKKK